MVGVLVGFSIIIGGLLAYVNHITEGPIKQKEQQTLAAGIKTVMQNNNIKVDVPYRISVVDGNIGYIFKVYRCKDSKRKNIGAAVEGTTDGFGGDIQILVGFNNDGKILGYTILKSSETPGLGSKAGVWFQKSGKGNIIGKKPVLPLEVKKDGGDIDAITASTITSRAFLKFVSRAYRAYRAKI